MGIPEEGSPIEICNYQNGGQWSPSVFLYQKYKVDILLFLWSREKAIILSLVKYITYKSHGREREGGGHVKG